MTLSALPLPRTIALSTKSGMSPGFPGCAYEHKARRAARVGCKAIVFASPYKEVSL